MDMASKLAIRDVPGNSKQLQSLVLLIAGGILLVSFLILTILYPLGALHSHVIPNAIESKPAWRLIEGGIITLDKPLYVAAMIAMHIVYLGALIIAIRRARSSEEIARRDNMLGKLVLGIGLACAVVLLWSYPLFSQDVFDYLFHTHEWVQYGASPFTHIPSQFSFDPLYPYVSWTDAPSPYGPVWILLTAPLSWLAVDDLFANLVLFKGLSVLCYAGSAFLLYLVLGKVLPRYRVAGTLLFAWNPLVLMEFGGSGHNDIVMVFFAILAAWLVLNGRFALGLLALTASMLIKIVTIFILPLFVVYVWRQLTGQARAGHAPPLRQRPKVAIYLQAPLYRLLGYFLLAAGVAALCYAPFWEGLNSMAFLRRGDIVGGAPVGNVVTGWIEVFRLGHDTASNIWKVFAWGSFAVFILRQTWVVWTGSRHTFSQLPGVDRLSAVVGWVTDGKQSKVAQTVEMSTETDTERLFRASLSIMFFYAVVVSQYYQPWYLSWALVWTGMLLRPPYRVMVWTLLLFSVVAVVGYVYL
ncbi:MAG TPA: hypothetical protein VJ183_11935 [Chloroflexia bacterium]|nr:hypothetical protein [Chloroflexia bacterium]